MNLLITFAVVWALIVLGCLIATLVITVQIYNNSVIANNASNELNVLMRDLKNDMAEIKIDLKRVYDWIIVHIL